MKSPPPSPLAVIMTLRLWQEQLDVEQCVCSQNAVEQCVCSQNAVEQCVCSQNAVEQCVCSQNAVEQCVCSQNANEQSEWRCQVKNLTTGEVRYFHGWDEMADIVPTMLASFDQTHHTLDGEEPQDG